MALHAIALAVAGGLSAGRPPEPTEPQTVALVFAAETPPMPWRSELSPADPPALQPPTPPPTTTNSADSSRDAVSAMEPPAPLDAIAAPPPVAPAEPPSLARSRPPQTRQADPRPARARPSPQLQQNHPLAAAARPIDPPAAARSGPPPVAASAEAREAWRGALAAWLREHRTYPEAARRDGVEGRVVVRFTIDRTGAVREATVERSSGSALLDDAAIAMLRGARLPPPPDAGDGAIALTLPVRYSLGP